jgi:4-amino-4-deoxy-L-arabinose transferase-like glycosyltransferase
MAEVAPRGRIDYDAGPTPLKTTLFLIVCLAWLLPGLVGRDPWKTDEAVVFGIVAEVIRSGQWVLFAVAGEPFPGKAPLLIWTAAALGKLLGGWMPLHDAARLAAGLYMAATLAALAATCHLLMGERAVRMGALLFLGCLGLLVRAHELSTALAGLAGVAVGLCGLALALKRPVAGGAVAGAGIGVGFLGGGILPAAMLVVLAAMLPLAGTAWRGRNYAKTAATAIAVAAPLLAAWPLVLASAGPGWLQVWWQAFTASRWNDPFGPDGLFYLARVLPWYAWPAWPLAAWTLWRARRAVTTRNDLLLPLVALVAFFITVSVLGEGREVDALPILLPLAILGVAEIESMPRGAASALDWFGMTTFVLLAALLWLGWVAALTGSPAFAAQYLEREVPGYAYRFNFVAFSLAALLTLMWVAVVARSLRSNRRALVNWTAGITMVWMLVMTLGVPLVDQARSYRGLAAQVVVNLPTGFNCVARRGVGDAQRALLDYFANLRTFSDEEPAGQRCNTVLVQAAPQRIPAPPPDAVEMWRGSRPGDRHELFIVYRRTPVALPGRGEGPALRHSLVDELDPVANRGGGARLQVGEAADVGGGDARRDAAVQRVELVAQKAP